MDRNQLIKALNRHSENSSACLILARKMIEIDNDSSRAWYDLGRSLLTLHRYNDARVALTKALKRAPKNKRCLVYFEIGDLYKEKGDYIEAIDWYKKGLEENILTLWEFREEINCKYIQNVHIIQYYWRYMSWIIDISL